MITQKISSFLGLYPEPRKASPQTRRTYVEEIEPELIWHFSGLGSARWETTSFSGRIYLSSSDIHYENYPADWEWRKYLVKQRANWKCEWCPSTEQLAADHIVEVTLWRNACGPLEQEPSREELIFKLGKLGPHHLTNLRCLCAKCHNLRHKRDEDGNFFESNLE